MTLQIFHILAVACTFDHGLPFKLVVDPLNTVELLLQTRTLLLQVQLPPLGSSHISLQIIQPIIGSLPTILCRVLVFT